MGESAMRATLTSLILGACATAAAALVFVPGCKDPAGSGGSTGNTIKIGEYASITGGTATFGVSSHEGTMMAIDQINAAGGVLGKKIEVTMYDDRSDQSEAATAVQKLISNDKVCAILGEVASKRSLAGAGICQKNRIPMVSPASTNPAVTQVGDYIFRVCFTDDFQGPVCAEFAQKKGWKKVAVLYDTANDYSKGLRKAFVETFTKAGGQIAADENYREGDNDFRAQLSTIKNAGVQAVFVPGYYGDVGNILKQARQLGISLPFFGGDGWDDPQTYQNLGSISDGCYFTNHYSPDDERPEVQAFIAAYGKRYKNNDGTPKVPDAMGICGYDAAKVLADAIKRANSTDPKAIRDALAQTKDFPGAGGKITIDANRNALKPIVIVELKGGKTRKVDSIVPKT
jgi:branched-chain amino acid transport system substrate-binding protein